MPARKTRPASPVTADPRAMRAPILPRLAALGWGLLAAATAGAQSDWLELRTERFNVVSELNERDTRRWAEEFSQFVDSLHSLLPLNQNLLPPLTAVLFKRSGGFSRYRVRTESGLVGGNQAVFIHYGSWSVIGLPASRSSDDSGTTYHEAVHWFMSADPTRYPLWFTEGIAEAFSTFDVKGGRARWGQSIRSHLEFLTIAGLQPMDEFLEVTQDQALHANASYYAQAWLFMHYLLFGREGGTAELGQFLNRLQETTVPRAFETSFNMEFGDMDRLLSAYLRSGLYRISQVEIEKPDADGMQVTPATPETVEISLARLALGTNNPDVVADHIATLLELDPMNAEAYDVLAAQRARMPDSDVAAMVDRAIAYGSSDANTYELKAAVMLDEVRKDNILFSLRALEPEDARAIVDHASRSIELRPVNLDAFRLFASALLCVDSTTDTDQRILDLGSAIYPREGIVLLGRAARALARDETDQALRLLDSALSSDYELSRNDEDGIEYLRDRLKRSVQ